MLKLVETMVKTGHLEQSFVSTGWGKAYNEPFLGSNDVFHKTNASESWLEYYSLTKYPGLFDHLVEAHMEDIVRFGYEADIIKMKQQLLDAAAAGGGGGGGGT